MPKIPDEYPKKLREIVGRCMHPDPSIRPNSSEVVNEINDAFTSILEEETYGKLGNKLVAILSEPSSEDDRSSTKTSHYKDPDDGGGEVEPEDFLRDALYRDDPKAMENLISAGADCNAPCFDDQGEKGDFSPREPYTTQGLEKAEEIRMLRKDSWASLKLIDFAIIMGSERCFDVLMSNDVNYGALSDGRCHRLLLAAELDRTEMIDTLIYGYGVDPDTKCSCACGQTALFRACQNANLNSIKLLLENNAAVVVRGDNSPIDFPIHSIIQAGNSTDWDRVLSGLNMLLEAAPAGDIDLQNPITGDNVCHIAVQEGASVEVIRRLISAGVNPHTKNLKGETAFDIENNYHGTPTSSAIQDALNGSDH
ncbi:hypothetical protein ABW20_dc0101184 [Dactylellina cionopaga]|nr:hypothetical protein ABW20_dc0101184 [Dactylellina cionopaga]